MNNIKTEELMGKFRANLADSSALYEVAIRTVEAAYDNEFEIVDPSSPALYFAQSSAIMAASAVQFHTSQYARMYPHMALSFEDLWMHLSSTEYYNLFAVPDRATFRVKIDVDTLYQQAIAVPGTNYSSVVIPRDTEVDVAGTPYSFLNAVEVRVYTNITDNSIKVLNVLGVDLVTSLIYSTVVRNPQGGRFVVFDVNLEQVHRKAVNYNITRSQGFLQDMDITDSLYKIHSYISVEGVWEEIETGYSDSLFNPHKNTAIYGLKSPTKLRVSIPPAFTINSSMGGQLLSVVELSKGAVNISPGSFSEEDITIEVDDKINGISEYNTAFINTSFAIYPPGKLEGGRAALSFEEAKQRFIDGSLGIHDVPVTSLHSLHKARDRGYESILEADTITSRTWVVTDTIPTHTNKIQTGIDVGVIPIETTLVDLRNSTHVGTGEQVVIPTGSLIIREDGVYRVSGVGVANNLLLSSPADLAVSLNRDDTFVIPFTYVFDNREGYISASIYRVNNPIVDLTSFVERNDSVPHLLRTENITVEYSTESYMLVSKTAPDPSLDTVNENEIFMQVSWIDRTSGLRVYRESHDVERQEDGSFICKAVLTTSGDIDTVEDTMGISNVYLKDTTQPLTGASIGITEEISIIYGLKIDIDGYMDTPTDDIVHIPMLGLIRRQVGQEWHRVKFGTNLSNLWNRTIIQDDGSRYKVHLEDVPLRYTRTQLLVNDIHGLPFSVNDNCEVSFSDPVYAGDIVKDTAGNIIYEHRKGDIVIINGQPVTQVNTDSRFVSDILVVDAKFMFSTDPTIVDLVSSSLDHIEKRSTVDIIDLSEQSLEATETLYRPRSSLGIASVNDMVGESSTIEKLLDITVKLIMEEGAKISDAAQQTIRSIVAAELQRESVEYNRLVDTLTASITGALGAIVSGIGGLSKSSPILTLIQKDHRLSVRKTMVVQDRLLSVVEELTIK